VRKLLLSFMTIASLIFPQLLYSAEEKNAAPLWKIFCAHWVTQNETAAVIVFDSPSWQELVKNLDSRTMPLGFALTDSNLDAWLRCENEFGARFDSAEFFSKGAEYFSVSVVSSVAELKPVENSESARLYSRKWTEFLESLQKEVTVPSRGHTILLRAQR
jgi:hypothetical protein